MTKTSFEEETVADTTKNDYSALLEKKIASREAIVGVIGLGYIGLSLLEAFGKAGFSLRGYDYNAERMKQLNKKESYLNFIDPTLLFKLLDQKKFIASSNPDVLKEADILVISVPTTLDRYRIPDLSNLRSAFKVVKSHLKKDQLVILQSSTYPGTTQEELLPLLENSHLTVGKDFFLAHVPEVADIGNPKFSFSDVPRIISGITPACISLAEHLYQSLGCKTVRTSCPKVAESAKLLQNAYRLLNISFVNEMKMMFDKMDIDVWEVIEAAASKPFGFQAFYPGPGIGGDCIPVAPFYMVWKARATGGPTTLLEQSGHINDMVPIYVFNKIIQGLNRKNKVIKGAKILLLGVGYKKDVNDIRESPAVKILSMLNKMQAEIHYNDPFVPELIDIPEFPQIHLKSSELDYDKLKHYDIVVVITDHSIYNWNEIVAKSELIVDTRNVTKGIKGAKQKVIKG